MTDQVCSEHHLRAHHLRATPRYKLFQPAEMTLAGGVCRVHILNLSAGGALLHAADPPRPGTALQVRCEDSAEAARVMWRAGKRFGIAFARPWNDARVQRVLAAQGDLVAEAARRHGMKPARYADRLHAGPWSPMAATAAAPGTMNG